MMTRRKRVAVVGGGISGLTTARLLFGAHDVVVFEAADHIGGHALTVEVPDVEGNPLRVDAGVCMFYSTGYPTFFELLRALRVPYVRSEITAEFLFIQDQQRYHFDLNAPWSTAANTLLHPSQYWLIKDGVSFYQDAATAAEKSDRFSPDLTLGEYLSGGGYSDEFRVFMSFLCGATWTLNQRGVDDLPFAFVARTMWELGFLPKVSHGAWQHVPGSVGSYLDALAEPMADNIRCHCQVEKVARTRGGSMVCAGGDEERFDEVIFAIPPAKALACLDEPTELEAEVLSAFALQDHTVVFTSELGEVASMDPGDFTLFAATDGYDAAMRANKEFVFRAGYANLSKMCDFATAEPFYMWYQFPDAPVPRQQYARVDFSTPQFCAATLKAQQRHQEISGVDGIHYCGASWINGIHEGGVRSAVRVASHFGRSIADI